MCVSERLKRFGLKCNVGDIVLSNPKEVSCDEIIGVLLFNETIFKQFNLTKV